MGEFSITHLIVLLVIFLVFFGPSRLPALGQSLGKAIRGFKQGMNEIDVDAKDVSQVPGPQSQQLPNQTNSQQSLGQATPQNTTEVKKS